MPTYLVIGANTMNCDSTTNSASASGPEFEPQGLKVRVRDVTLLNGHKETTVRGFSLATLAAALAACGGGGSGGPAPPPPPPPPPPPNNAPTASPDAGAAMEDGDAITGSTGGADEDGDALTYAVSDGGSGTYGSLTVADDGTWTYTVDNSNDAVQALAEGATLTDTATITVSDPEDSVEATVTITITGVNDDPTGSDGAGAVTAGTDMAAMGDVMADDVDEGDTHTFAVETPAMYGELSVDEAGAWTYMLNHDNEAVMALAEGATMEDTATIMVTDSSGGTAMVTVTITITGINENPTAMDGTGAVKPGGDMVAMGDVMAADVDEGDTHTFSITDGTYGTFEIDEAGAWTYTLDATHADVVAMNEGDTVMDTATVTVMDNNGGSTTAMVTVTVTGSNDAPGISVMDGTVPNEEMTPAMAANDENMAGIPLGAVMLSDPDSGQMFDASNVTTSDERFVIKTDAIGGLWLALADGVSLDHEAAATVDVTVTVTDDHGATADAVVTITVNNVDEAPYAPTLDATEGALTVAENNTDGDNIGTLSSHDPEGDDITYSVDNAHFEIETVGGTAVLKYADGAGLDYEATEDGTVTIMVTATDSQDNASEATAITVTVTDVNEMATVTFDGDSETPDGMAAVSTVPENVEVPVPVGAILIDDPENALTAANVTLSDPRFRVETDALGGLWLMLDHSIDHDTLEDGTVTVTITVDDGDVDPDPVEAVITIADVNEVPTIEVADRGSVRAVVSENEADVRVGLITVTDQEEDLDQSNITLSDTDSFSMETDEAGHIWLVVTQAADYETDGDTLSVTLTVTDSDNLSAETTVDVAVVNVNEAPTIEFDGDSETPDGMPAVSTIDEHVGDGDFTPVPVGLVTASDPEQGSITADNIEVSDSRFSLMTDDFGGIWLMLNEGLDADVEGGGSVTVMLTATDASGLTSETEAVITVNNINEAPTIIVREGVVPAADGGAGASGALDENATGPAYEIIISDPEDDLTADNVTIDDARFEVKVDSEGGLWAFLKDEVNFEGADRMNGTADDISSIDILVTVTDSDGASSMSMVTVTINDVNDAPYVIADAEGDHGVRLVDNAMTEDVDESAQAVSSFDATAGVNFQLQLDLKAMFADEDGDSIFTYRLDDAPSWLTVLNVQYGDDGEVTGMTLSAAPPAGADMPAEGVKIVATDEGGASGYAMFDIIIDDGNDVPTAIHLFNQDDNSRNDFFDLEVEEGEQGTLLGYLTVEDQDDPRHSHGQHTWKVDNEAFEIVDMDGRQTLKIKDDAKIDFEATPTIMLAVTVTDGGMGSHTQMISVDVHNMNDPVVVANQPGDWWVTINEDLDPETVTAGQYLQFALEVENADPTMDTLPLFTDPDAADATLPNPDDATMPIMVGELTYAIESGPDWLMIDEDTGVIQNKAGMEDDELPERGVYDITVSATDGAGSKAEATFKLAVAVSGADNADNDDPDIGSRQEFDVVENSAAGTVVATFTVTDDDLDLTETVGDETKALHPWADLTVVIESIQGTPTDGGTAVDLAAGVLELEVASRDSDSVTYNVKVTAAGVAQLNYETYDEITFNVRAYDGVGDNTDANSDLVGFDFEITDVNEAPAYMRDTDTTHSSDITVGAMDALSIAVEQELVDPDPADMTDGNGIVTVYLNLSKLFNDPDEDDDDDELTYSISENTPWIEISTNVGEWRDVQEGPDGDDGTDDDVTWGTTDAPGDRDYVAILQIDRTGMNNTQDADGSFTITVSDVNGASESFTVTVDITDENIAPSGTGVTISDDTPHQNDRLSMRFNDSVDPDFVGAEAGEPVAVLYQWHRDNADATDGDGDLQSVSVDTPSHYMVTQDDVDMVIQGSVVYYELFGGMIVKTEAGANDETSAVEARSQAVADRPDAATGTVTLGMTNASNQLVATVSVADVDGIADADDNGTVNSETNPLEDLTFTWEYSANGRGGWQDFDADGVADDDPNTDGIQDNPDTNIATIPADVAGNYVRLVVTFNDDNGTPERIVSDTIKVGTIATAAAPAITGFGAEGISAVAVGRTLEVDITDAEGNDVVEWLNAEGMILGTGTSFTVTSAHAGAVISVRVSTKDAMGNVTSISTTASGSEATVAGAATAPNTQAIAVDDVPVVLLGKAPEMAGTLEEYSTTIDASALFEDVEGGLMFSFAGETALGTDEYAGEEQSIVSQLSTDGTQLLIIDETTGEVRYWTTKTDEHGDGGEDGAGNWVEVTVTANEMVGGSPVTTTNTVRLAIDVEGSTDATPTLTGITENTATTANASVATINIDDNNSPMNEYGQYTWTISDDRFTITPVGSATENDLTDDDSSQAVIGLKADQMFDIPDVDEDDNNVVDDGEIEVTITATPVSGNYDPIEITLTVTVTNNTADDPDDPTAGNQVPGLKDNETDSNTNTDNEEEDDTTDDDDDAGTPPLEEDMASTVSMLDDGILF